MIKLAHSSHQVYFFKIQFFKNFSQLLTRIYIQWFFFSLILTSKYVLDLTNAFHMLWSYGNLSFTSLLVKEWTPAFRKLCVGALWILPACIQGEGSGELWIYRVQKFAGITWLSHPVTPRNRCQWSHLPNSSERRATYPRPRLRSRIWKQSLDVLTKHNKLMQYRPLQGS